jgi:hypothetical protein
MSRLTHPGRLTAGLTVVGLLSGCAASAARTPAQPAAPKAAVTTAGTATVATRRTSSATRPTARTAAIDQLTQTARRRYAIEVHGGVAIGTLHRVGRDPTLLRTLQSGNLSATRAYVQRQFQSVWYHWHASRVRILKGSQVVVDAGVPFVVAPSTMTLRGPGGRSLGTLEVSIQDVIGFVRYMHRNYPVDVVVRGQGAAHVRSSLPAATTAKLPSSGTVTLAGQRYAVRSFRDTALASEPVTVWVLAKG